MNIRRLDPVKDEELLKEAYSWDRTRPQWYLDMDAVYGPDDFSSYIRAAKGEQRIDIGMFADELVTVFVLSERSPQRFEVHIMAKRGINNQMIAEAACQIQEQLFQRGAKSISGWIASRNRPLLELARMVGFVKTRLTMMKGSYRGRVIEWVNVVSVP